MDPTISEFSYGFALTRELIESPGYPLTAAPVFPSLIQEGRPGGGYDVRLDRPSLPLFLQFKLCHYMRRRTCREVRDGGFNVPCYRMPVRPARFSEQHDMLLALESAGEEVYYSAPMFHTPDELNTAYLSHTVRARSIWIRPSDIGPLPDGGDHHVSFESGGPWTFFSEPKPLRAKRTVDDVFIDLALRLKRPAPKDTGRDRFESLAERIAAIAEKRSDIVASHESFGPTVGKRGSVLDRIAYFATLFFEAQFYLVQTRSG